MGTRGHGPIDDQPIGLTANGYKCGRMCDGRLAYPHTNTCQKDRPMHNDPKARHPDHDGKKRKGGASQNKTAAPDEPLAYMSDAHPRPDKNTTSQGN